MEKRSILTITVRGCHSLLSLLSLMYHAWGNSVRNQLQRDNFRAIFDSCTCPPLLCYDRPSRSLCCMSVLWCVFIIDDRMMSSTSGLRSRNMQLEQVCAAQLMIHLFHPASIRRSSRLIQYHRKWLRCDKVAQHQQVLMVDVSVLLSIHWHTQRCCMRADAYVDGLCSAGALEDKIHKLQEVFIATAMGVSCA